MVYRKLANKYDELNHGNCGMLAIALHEKFHMDSFLFVENEAEPNKLYHIRWRRNYNHGRFESIWLR